MILELTDAQQAFQQQVAAFAASGVAPRGRRASTSADTFPRDIVRAAAAPGCWASPSGGSGAAAGCDYVSYALAIEALARASAVVAVIVVGEQLAGRRADREVRHATRRSRRLAAAARAAGRRSARSRCRRSTPAPTRPTSRRSRRLDERGYVLNGRKVWVANAEAADLVIVFAATQPGMRGRGACSALPRADGYARHRRASPRTIRSACAASAAWTSSSRRPGRRRRAARRRPAKAFGIAMWALDGGRVAIAAQALGVGAGGARGGAAARQGTRGVRPADRATTRRSSGCSPTWRPSSKRRGCSR